jgi:hypothetical protein
MSAQIALSNFDRYLSGLKLSREEHVAIQMHVAALRKEIETGGQ